MDEIVYSFIIPKLNSFTVKTHISSIISAFCCTFSS